MEICSTGWARRPAAERKTSRLSGAPGPAGGGAAASHRRRELRRHRPVADTRIPTLVMHGAQDRIIPAANAQRLADGIAGAQLVVFPDAGHVYTTDAPDAANQACRFPRRYPLTQPTAPAPARPPRSRPATVRRHYEPAVARSRPGRRRGKVRTTLLPDAAALPRCTNLATETGPGSSIVVWPCDIPGGGRRA